MEFGEDFGGVAFGADGVPDFFDFAFGIDKKAAANNAEERASEKLLHASRAVGLNRFQVGITEKVKIELVLGLEAGLGFNGIAAQAEDHRVEFVELLLRVAKLGRFDSSTRGVGLGKEKEDHALAAKVEERDIGAGVVLQLECGSFVAGFEHERSSVAFFGDVTSNELTSPMPG